MFFFTSLDTGLENVGREESRVCRGQGDLHSLLNLAQMLQLVNITIWPAGMPKWCFKNFLQKHAIWTLASGNMVMHFLHYNVHTVFPSMKHSVHMSVSEQTCDQTSDVHAKILNLLSYRT